MTNQNAVIEVFNNIANSSLHELNTDNRTAIAVRPEVARALRAKKRTLKSNVHILTHVFGSQIESYKSGSFVVVLADSSNAKSLTLINVCIELAQQCAENEVVLYYDTEQNLTTLNGAMDWIAINRIQHKKWSDFVYQSDVDEDERYDQLACEATASYSKNLRIAASSELFTPSGVTEMQDSGVNVATIWNDVVATREKGLQIKAILVDYITDMFCPNMPQFKGLSKTEQVGLNAVILRNIAAVGDTVVIVGAQARRDSKSGRSDFDLPTQYDVEWSHRVYQKATAVIAQGLPNKTIKDPYIELAPGKDIVNDEWLLMMKILKQQLGGSAGITRPLLICQPMAQFWVHPDYQRWTGNPYTTQELDEINFAISQAQRLHLKGTYSMKNDIYLDKIKNKF